MSYTIIRIIRNKWTDYNSSIKDDNVPNDNNQGNMQIRNNRHREHICTNSGVAPMDKERRWRGASGTCNLDHQNVYMIWIQFRKQRYDMSCYQLWLLSYTTEKQYNIIYTYDIHTNTQYNATLAAVPTYMHTSHTYWWFWWSCTSVVGPLLRLK